MRSIAKSLLLLLVVLSPACSGSGGGDAAAGDTLTRAQRDSVIGASRLPGARGVQRALDVSDTAAARNAAMDSLMR